jgi:hypothetical protein
LMDPALQMTALAEALDENIEEEQIPGWTPQKMEEECSAVLTVLAKAFEKSFQEPPASARSQSIAIPYPTAGPDLDELGDEDKSTLQAPKRKPGRLTSRGSTNKLSPKSPQAGTQRTSGRGSNVANPSRKNSRAPSPSYDGPGDDPNIEGQPTLVIPPAIVTDLLTAGRRIQGKASGE